MKILQINAVYGYGSTGIIVKDIQQQCQVNGIECVCAYSMAKGRVENGYHIGNRFTNKIHALLTRISGKQGYFSYFSTWKLLRFLDSYKPDIVHLHNLHSGFVNIPILLKYLAQNKIRTIITLHDCWFYTGGCTHYTAVGCDKWRHSCGNCPKRYDDFPALLWDSSAKQLADRRRMFNAIRNLTVVGVSEWITQQAKSGIFKDSNCIAIHNGVDTDFFCPVQSDFREKHNLEGKFIILAPANKWFLPINRETLEIVSQNLDEDMVLVFFGASIAPECLKSNMMSVGFINSREELRELYSAADVMVNCSREDTLPTLTLEVQACGTPVVAYANTGVTETVAEKGGFIVENGNPWELLENLRIVHQRGKDAYSEDCRRWVLSNFRKEDNYLRYIKLFQDIAN